MTAHEKDVFYQGVDFSRSLLKEYTKRHFSRECKTLVEKRDYVFSIWSFIEELTNVNYLDRGVNKLIDDVFAKYNVSQGELKLFIEGVEKHNNYVKFCFQNGKLATVDIYLKDYFFGRTDFIPNKIYSNFEDFISE